VGQAVSGGWTQILADANAQDKLRVFDFYTGFDRPFTAFAGIIGGAVLTMASHGADQTIVQRMLSARSLKDAQKAIIGSGIAVLALMTLFLTVGIGLWSYYQGTTFTSPDQIFPTFIFEKMPNGLIGLLVASILAATMSTHSGAINSLAATTTHDIYVPLFKKAPNEAATFRAGRWFALAWGVALTFGALLFPEGRTPVVEIALSIASFTQGALLGGFFLGIFVKRAVQRDAIVGMSIGIAVMAFVVFAKQLSAAYPWLASTLGPLANIAWPWYVLIGTTITVGSGFISSYVRRSPDA
jgi:Na+/proline symporter